jgi:N-acetylglutamate synthase-like GNAT family acetyltransferase
MATRGRLLEITALPGFVAERDGELLGYVAYNLDAQGLEVALLESVVPKRGAGRALLAACVAEAQGRAAPRVWLITTNDNTDALRFYQRLGFVLVALHRGAVSRSRRDLKPEIPAVAASGIPIRDELELELPPEEWAAFVEAHAWPS